MRAFFVASVTTTLRISPPIRSTPTAVSSPRDIATRSSGRFTNGLSDPTVEGAQPLAHPPQLAESPDDHADARSVRLSGRPRAVMHAHLDDAGPGAPQLDEQLRIDHCAHRLDVYLLQHAAVEELEAAVDVPHRDVEQQPDQQVPGKGVQAAHEDVLPVDAVAGDDVYGPRVGKELLDLVHVELEVRVGEEHIVEPARQETGPQRLAVAPVAPV